MDSDRDPASQDPSDPDPNISFVRMGLFFYGAMAIVAVLWRVGLSGEPIFFSGAEASDLSATWMRDLGLGLVVGAAIIALSAVFTKYTDWGMALSRAMAEAIGPLSIPNAVLLAFASGLAEEMFFRGALQPWAGWVLASLLFGLVHYVPRPEFRPWTFFAIAVGFLFGFLFDWTGNLIAPIVAHTLVNAVNLPLLVREAGRQQP